MKIFESNLKVIEEHNEGFREGKYTWSMGINQFTDLTAEEFGKLNNLQIPNDSPRRKFAYKMKAKEVNSSVDWRKMVSFDNRLEIPLNFAFNILVFLNIISALKGVVTEVKDQMNCGSCWAFGAVASIEAAHAQKYGELISMSEQQLVDCVEDTSCATGGLPSKAWEYVNKAGGINSEENYPYEGCKTECRFDEHHIVASVLNFTKFERDGDEENLIRRLNDHPQTVAIVLSMHPCQGGLLQQGSFSQGA